MNPAIVVHYKSFVSFDNLEVLNYKGPDNLGNASCFELYDCTNCSFTNMYVHDWHPNGVHGTNNAAFYCNACSLIVIHNNIITLVINNNLYLLDSTTNPVYITDLSNSYTIAQGRTQGWDHNSLFSIHPGLSFSGEPSSGSPTIDKGKNLASYFDNDLAGNLRPLSGAWDIGPFQYTVLAGLDNYLNNTGNLIVYPNPAQDKIIFDS